MRERPVNLEILSHCWKYPRLLAYQISSLFLYPSSYNVRLTVCCSKEDSATIGTLIYYATDERIPDNLTIRPWMLPTPRLMRRAIGRNAVALSTEADVVWFADADYLFREGPVSHTNEDGTVTEITENCIDYLLGTDLSNEQIVFPRRVRKTESMEAGDALIELMSDLDVRDIPEDKFCDSKIIRAIGGVQIVKGTTARRYGYLPNHSKFQTPCDRWMRTKEDPVYRKAIAAGRGTPINLPGAYRIRHSDYGRENPDTEN